MGTTKVIVVWFDQPQAAGEAEIASAARWCEWMRQDESNAIGFIPSAEGCYRKAARNGRLCLALIDDMLMPVGFCYFGIRNRTLRVQQIAVIKGIRRCGVGTHLLTAAMSRYSDSIDRVALRCRDDLPAVHFWKSLGFLPGEVREHVGARGKLVREYSLDDRYQITGRGDPQRDDFEANHHAEPGDDQADAEHRPHDG